MKPTSDETKVANVLQHLKLDFEVLLGSKPKWKEIASFVDSAVERAYMDFGKEEEFYARYPDSGGRRISEPERLTENAQYENSEQILGGIAIHSWVWEYADSLTFFINQSMLEDPLTHEYRQKHGVVENTKQNTREIFRHIADLVKESGVDPYGENPMLNRLYLYLGEDWDTNESHESIPIPKNPTPKLADLLTVIRTLSAKYKVSNAAALYAVTQDNYIITHSPYVIKQRDGVGPFRRIVLELDPKIPSIDVKNIYDYARKKIGWWQRPVSKKTLELAEFGSRFPDYAWEDLLADWEFNPRSAQWRYRPEYPRFSTDATKEEVEAVHADYARKTKHAEKNFMRDANAAWRWVFGTAPPKRKELGEKSKGIREMLDMHIGKTKKDKKSNGK